MNAGLPRFISTIETAKHRWFTFLDADVLPDNMLVNVALDDAYFLGVLSSRVHVVWSLAAGGRLGIGNDPRYTKSRCFDPFPFPEPGDAQRAQIRDLAEKLDAHRKDRLRAHPTLTVTGMYNVLAMLRAGEALDEKSKGIHQQALTTVLREFHDALDAAVFDAYGWPRDLDDEAILERVVALNRARADAETQGDVRWLRPAFQAPTVTATQGALAVDAPDEPAAAESAAVPPWPARTAEQLVALRALLESQDRAWDVASVGQRFRGARATQVEDTLDGLAALGLVLRFSSPDGPRWTAPPARS